MRITTVRAGFRVVALFILCSGWAAFGAPSPGIPAARSHKQTVLPGNAGTVRLWITAVQGGNLVIDLKKEDLELWVGKKEETISKLTFYPATPLLVGLLIDTSGSRRVGWRGPELYLAPGFIKNLLWVRDLAFLVHFNDDVYMDVDPTANLIALDQGLRKIAELTPRGGTALYDAIDLSCSLLNRYPDSHHALVVVTDGEDDASTYTREQAVRAAQISGARVFFIAYGPRGNSIEGRVREMMNSFARSTGGMVFTATDKSDLALAMNTLTQALRGEYALDFQPSSRIKRHPRIRIKCLRRGVKIIAPQRY